MFSRKALISIAIFGLYMSTNASADWMPVAGSLKPIGHLKPGIYSAIVQNDANFGYSTITRAVSISEINDDGSFTLQVLRPFEDLKSGQTAQFLYDSGYKRVGVDRYFGPLATSSGKHEIILKADDQGLGIDKINYPFPNRTPIGVYLGELMFQSSN
jgi:hypothetical protein